MASNSSGGPSSSRSGSAEYYDVFISFRGKDTRLTFTSHLYQALCDHGIDTFIDKELQRGDEINPALATAIQGSAISVVILSEDYASSRWCLDELVTILECRRRTGQRVIPVFYHIDPSIVRKQSGTYAESFESHEERFQGKLQEWREALTVVASLSGHDIDEKRTESDFVNEIVEDVMQQLNGLYINRNKIEGLVGMERHVRRVEWMLDVGSGGVRTVGIWGMGGIGKTTIARVVFKNLSSRFETRIFMANVAKNEDSYGLEERQIDLYSTLTSTKRRRIDTLPNASFMQHRLREKKILLVLDDVRYMEQLRTLIEEREMFGSGSRIILTGRDKKLLEGHAEANEIYEVPPMYSEDALHLFSLKAFRESHPPEDYLELSKMVVKYAYGLPLAVEVLGCLFHGERDFVIWESGLAKLKEMAPEDVIGKLRISYDTLDDRQKEIFVDISCHLRGSQLETVKGFLKSYGKSLDWDIKVLKERCFIYEYRSSIYMHDLLAEMGCQIDRQEAKEPETRRRLWHPADICKVLVLNTVGSSGVHDLLVSFLGLIFNRKVKEMEVELLSLDVSQLGETIVTLDSAVFERMPNLRSLRFYNTYYNNYAPALLLSNGLKMLPNELMFLCWENYPLKSLPCACSWANNLVELHMPNSKIKKLSFGNNQILPNLEIIDLSSSLELTEIADLSQTPNIKRIRLHRCKRLIRVASSTFLNQLTHLYMDNCCGLKEFFLKGNISWLDLTGFGEDLCRKMKYIDVESSSDEDEELVEGLNNCGSESSLKDALSFPMQEAKLMDRDFYNPGGHRGCRSPSPITDELTKLIHSVVSLSSLTVLYLNGIPIKTLPRSIIYLSQLDILSVEFCECLHSLPVLPQSIIAVKANDCISLKRVSSFANANDAGIGYCYDFGNCFKLDETSYNNILEASLALVMNPNNLGCVEFVGLPTRSDIWRYFPYQAEGNLLVVEDITPAGSQLLIGFAFAVVYDGLYEIDCRVSEVVDESSKNNWTVTISPTTPFGDFVQFGSMFNRGSGRSGTFTFQFMPEFDEKCPRVSLVKKCGVKPLYIPHSQVRQFREKLEEKLKKLYRTRLLQREESYEVPVLGPDLRVPVLFRF